MKTRNFILILILNFLISITLLDLVSIKGIVPNTFLIFTVLIGVLKKRRWGIAFGTISGFLIDITFYNVLGINTSIFMLIGLLSEVIGKKVTRDKFKISLLVVFMMTIVEYILKIFLEYITGSNINMETFVDITFLIKPIYNVLITIPLYFLVRGRYEKPMVSFRKEK